MRRIELTPRTIGVVMDRLQRATGGQFYWERGRDQKPLKIKKVDFKKLEAMAKITVHWDYSDFKNGEKAIKHQTCLLHLFVNMDSQMYYTYGDVFYFKGKMILIDRKGQYDVSHDVYRCVERIAVVKLAKHLSQDDKNNAARKRFLAKKLAEEDEKNWWKNFEFQSMEDMLGIYDN